MALRKTGKRTTWAIGRAMTEDVPEMVLACVILTYAKTMAATPSRKANPGVQVIAVAVNVAALEKFKILSDPMDVLPRIQRDRLLLNEVLRDAVGLNYVTQIAGGGGYVQGPHADTIGFAACTIYKVRMHFQT